MIPKRIQPTHWFPDRPISQLLQVHSHGIERSQLQKIASSEAIKCLDIRPEPGYSFVHVISVAAGEVYGTNNNGDYFNEKCAEFVFPEPIGARSRMLDGGLKAYHSTFKKYGGVYRNHQNSKKGFEPQGDVYAEAYNDPMHRGELILKLANDPWAESIQKLATGQHVWWSMGTSVPYDICGMCGNQARNRTEYCRHLRYDMLGLNKEGYQNFAINDTPTFHDISHVVVPAERICFTLDKVASGLTIEEDISRSWIPVDVMNRVASRTEANRYDILHKLAKIEKRILAEGMTPDEESVSSAFCPCDEDAMVNKLQGYPLENLLNATTKYSILIPPRAFIRLVVKKPVSEIKGLVGMPDAVRNVFSDFREHGNPEELLSDGSYLPGCGYPGSVNEVVGNLEESLSLKAEPLRRRIVVIAIRGQKPLLKQASQPGAEARILAREYAKYQLSFLASAPDDYVHLTALHNQVTA